jgi:hypothetical protein
MNSGRLLAGYALVILLSALSITFVCVYVVPPIHYLFTTVGKAVSALLAGA